MSDLIQKVETDDVHEAALLAVMYRLLEIDKDVPSRNQFATNILVNQMYGGASKPVFEDEINLICRALNIKPPQQQQIAKEEVSEPAPTQAREFQLNDL